jgi:hypothetical protein
MHTLEVDIFGNFVSGSYSAEDERRATNQDNMWSAGWLLRFRRNVPPPKVHIRPAQHLLYEMVS